MPALAKEANFYPRNLWEDQFDQQDRNRCWWALYTKARQEKAVARYLTGARIPFYLPLVPKDSLIRGRRVRSYLPLFQGYLFLFGTDDERVQTLTTNRISHLLPVPDQCQLRQDLHHVERLIEAEAPLTVESRIAAGRRVRIKSGAMAGLEGIVTARRGKTRLQVAVNFLQQGASVEVDDFLLEPLD